jgi:hypothetical protein
VQNIDAVPSIRVGAAIAQGLLCQFAKFGWANSQGEGSKGDTAATATLDSDDEVMIMTACCTILKSLCMTFYLDGLMVRWGGVVTLCGRFY